MVLSSVDRDEWTLANRETGVNFLESKVSNLNKMVRWLKITLEEIGVNIKTKGKNGVFQRVSRKWFFKVPGCGRAVPYKCFLKIPKAYFHNQILRQIQSNLLNFVQHTGFQT